MKCEIEKSTKRSDDIAMILYLSVIVLFALGLAYKCGWQSGYNDAVDPDYYGVADHDYCERP